MDKSPEVKNLDRRRLGLRDWVLSVQLCPKHHGCNPAIFEGFGLEVIFSQGSELGSPVPTSDLRSNDS